MDPPVAPVAPTIATFIFIPFLMMYFDRFNLQKNRGAINTVRHVKLRKLRNFNCRCASTGAGFTLVPSVTDLAGLGPVAAYKLEDWGT
jgi:hypothetical protein